MPRDMWNDLFEKTRSLCLKSMPATAQLAFKHQSRDDAWASEIREGEHYFGLTLNEIHLRYGQEFHVSYDPLVYLAIDFRYGSQRVTIPRLVGPSALGAQKINKDGKLPHGFVVKNVRIAGPHPYRGGPVGITLVLYKVAHTNYAKRVLEFAEKLSGVIGFPADISIAFKIGETVTDAIEALFDMNDSVPIMGRRFEINSSPKDGFQPQYVALVNDSDKSLPPLDVRNGSLVVASGEPLADREYVLLNLWGTESRGSEASLPTDTMVEKMCECGLAGDAESWQRGKSILITLYQQLLNNIDLTEPDAELFFEKYKAKLIKCKERAKLVALMPVEAVNNSVVQRRTLETARLNKNAREILALPD
ncbi:conserved hypothetical protein [Paraburkholderia ribeironis]|uniref:Uncharacterized protein n=1 Tax=Paraburkholderia ribeironis TaxID=1247936 RepID=A0A1N7S7M2_9BURK|nr:hypothetical protein [Paraburkholderia ribeironis]SIT43364.1 conserved hypothetical protein [Paraburkholderia ribeironis]